MSSSAPVPALFHLVRRILALATGLLLVGCAATPQAPVSMAPNALASGMRVGVTMSNLPDSDLHLPGASCLLCLATAEAMNSSLSNYVNGLKPNEFSVVKSQLIGLLEEKGIYVVPIETPFNATEFPKSSSKEANTSPRDFSQLRDQYNVTHLLVVDVEHLGMWRSYANYIPTSDPMAYLKASSYLVNLANNQYVWFQPLEFKRPADGDWDEPPSFPGLTNAYFQVLEEARESIVSEF